MAFTIGQAPAAQAALQRIMRDYEQTQKTYENLFSRRDTLALTESLGAAGRGVEYQVFERPQAALTPSDPPRLLLILAATLAAIGAGAGAGFLLTVIEKSYSQAEELREAFGLPVLGALSEVPSDAVTAYRRRDIFRLGLATAGLFALTLGYIYLSVLRAPFDRADENPSAATVTHFTERLR